MRTALSLFLLMLLLSSPAKAADADNVKFWLPHCKVLLSSAGQADRKGAYLAGQCLGMIKASAFIMQAAQPGGLPFRACLPDNAVTSDQLVNVVLQWMEKNPNLLAEDFIVVTMLAMTASWPCK